MNCSRSARAIVVTLLLVAACRPPRIAPLEGTAVAGRSIPLPPAPTGYRKVVFRWELRDGELVARGDGVARIAYPDSVRLDFFLGGGLGGGAAVLIGDSLQAPGPDAARRLIPPRPLLWAALGRLDVPASRDTLIRVDGGTLRADIGTPVNWRVTFHGDSLARLERVDAGRLQEWVDRGAGGVVQYRNEGARRSLSLVIQHTDAVAPFDPSIWSL